MSCRRRPAPVARDPPAWVGTIADLQTHVNERNLDIMDHYNTLLDEMENNLDNRLYMARTAAVRGRIDLLQHLLDKTTPEKKPWRLDLLGEAMRTAATYGYYDFVKYCLDQGSDPNFGSNIFWQIDHTRRSNSTALINAVTAGEIRVARLLLGRGANVNAHGVLQTTALHAAVQKGHVEMARLLLDHGANRREKNDDGHTAEDFARSYGTPAMRDLFLPAHDF